MSTRYKSPLDVPAQVLADRLDELADVICKKRDRIDAEFAMRVPAECDRDADLVLAEAARRLREQDNGSTEGGDAEFIDMPAFLRRDQESSNRADGWDAEAYSRMRGEIQWWKEKAEKTEELLEALKQAKEWLEGWASAQPQLAVINAALRPTGREAGHG